jgi:shikimate dehydrogenase
VAQQHSTRRAAVLGSPISHSLSPGLHRAAYAALGLNWTYDAIEVDETGLAGFIAGLDDSWGGLSLTMPLKEAVIELLDEVDPIAQATVAVNTVLPCPSGWGGTNTDITGMVKALIEGGLEPGSTAGLVLGAGATARSALAALARLGVDRVLLSARRPEAARALLSVAERFALSAKVVPWEVGARPQGMGDVGVTISTVPGDAGAAWSTFAAHATGALLDAAYHPWPTPLAAAWSGKVIASGREMLLWQAAEQVQLMTGLQAPVAAMRAALPPA